MSPVLSDQPLTRLPHNRMCTRRKQLVHVTLLASVSGLSEVPQGRELGGSHLVHDSLHTYYWDKKTPLCSRILTLLPIINT